LIRHSYYAADDAFDAIFVLITYVIVIAAITPLMPGLSLATLPFSLFFADIFIFAID
jgi:hypothetical protein